MVGGRVFKERVKIRRKAGQRIRCGFFYDKRRLGRAGGRKKGLLLDGRLVRLAADVTVVH